MTAPIILLLIAGVLVLLSLLPVGARVEYSAEGLQVRLKLGAVFVSVFPMKSRKKKVKKPPKEPGENAPAGKKRGGDLALFKECLPLVADAAGGLKEKLTIELLRIDLLWSDPDPAACALGFGAANAAAGMIWPLIAQNFHVKEHRIRTAVDFEAGKPAVSLLAQMSLRLGQLIVFSLRLAVRFFGICGRVRKQQKAKQGSQQKEAV